MHHLIVTVLALMLATASFAQDMPKTPEIKDDMDRINYSIGHQIGDEFKQQGVRLSPELLVRGVEDALAGTEPLMSVKERWSTLSELRKKTIVSKRMQKARDSAEGKIFLEENAKKEGVVTLGSGLQYVVLKEGIGRTPVAGDDVTIQYRGMYIDGTEFDSSYRKEKPSSLRLDSLIPGWKEALQRMKEGDKWRIFLPPNLAYGERKPMDGKTVIFELELVSVQPATERKVGGK